MGESFKKCEKIYNQVLSFDGICCNVEAWVIGAKSRKYAKSRNLRPIFGFCGGVVVIMRGGCRGLEGFELLIYDHKINCDSIWLRVGFEGIFKKGEEKLKS